MDTGRKIKIPKKKLHSVWESLHSKASKVSNSSKKTERYIVLSEITKIKERSISEIYKEMESVDSDIILLTLAMTKKLCSAAKMPHIYDEIEKLNYEIYDIYRPDFHNNKYNNPEKSISLQFNKKESILIAGIHKYIGLGPTYYGTYMHVNVSLNREPPVHLVINVGNNLQEEQKKKLPGMLTGHDTEGAPYTVPILLVKKGAQFDIKEAIDFFQNYKNNLSIRLLDIRTLHRSKNQ